MHMKKFTKTICIVMALSMVTSLLTACPNDAKSSSQKDDRTDLTTRQTETELKPGLSEPDQTISTMDTEKEKETTEPETSSSEVTTASQTTAKPTAKPKAIHPQRAAPAACVQCGATAIRSRATSQMQM